MYWIHDSTSGIDIGIGIISSKSTGNWKLGAKLDIILTVTQINVILSLVYKKMLVKKWAKIQNLHTQMALGYLIRIHAGSAIFQIIQQSILCMIMYSAKLYEFHGRLNDHHVHLITSVNNTTYSRDQNWTSQEKSDKILLLSKC